MCVSLGSESEKATATKYIFSVVFSVFPKCYEKINKGPLLLSAHLEQVARQNIETLISAQGAYSNYYGTLVAR